MAAAWDAAGQRLRAALRAEGLIELSGLDRAARAASPQPIFWFEGGALWWRDPRSSREGQQARLDRLLATLDAGPPDPLQAGLARVEAQGGWLALETLLFEHGRDREASIRSVRGLIGAGLAEPAQREDLERVAASLRVGLTPTMAGQLRGPEGPIARQLLPSAAELHTHPAELVDPIGDQAHSPVRGVVHRYPDRALLMPTLRCAVYCRFCFRREAVGQPEGGALSAEELDRALDYLRVTPALFEVILTGGDPLVLSAGRLATLLAALHAIPHVQVLRIHTRVPLVAPERIDAALLASLAGPKPVFIVLHVNHADELSAAGRAAIARLVDAGHPMLSQTVLLRGVNDTVEAQVALARALLRHRVKPYYLHHLDLAQGTSHFRVPLREGAALVAGMRAAATGLAQPTYVLDLPGGHGKVPVGPTWIWPDETPGCYRVRDPRGGEHPYVDPADPPPSREAR